MLSKTYLNINVCSSSLLMSWWVNILAISCSKFIFSILSASSITTHFSFFSEIHSFSMNCTSRPTVATSTVQFWKNKLLKQKPKRAKRSKTGQAYSLKGNKILVKISKRRSGAILDGGGGDTAHVRLRWSNVWKAKRTIKAETICRPCYISSNKKEYHISQ